MKLNINIRFLKATLVTAFLLSLFILACQKTRNKEPFEERKYTEFSLLGRKLKAKNISSYDIPQRSNSVGRTSQQSALSSYAEIGDNGIDSIVDDLKNAISGDIADMPKSPYTLILYSTEGGSITSISSIYAVSYFLIVDDKLEHHFLTISSGTSSSVSKYDATGDNITHAELDLLAESYMPHSDTFGYAMMKNLDLSTGGLSMSQGNNGLAQVLINSGDNKLPIEESAGCAKPLSCGGSKTGACTYNITWYCQDATCRFVQVKSKGEDSSLTDPFNPLSTNKAYSYRDSLMSNYAIGRKYIDYYYTLSYFGNAFKTSLNASNLVQHVQLAYKLFNFCEKLKNGSNTDVLVDSSFRTLALALIYDYRQLSTNSEFQAILDDISNDLYHFLNKTRSQVLAEI